MPNAKVQPTFEVDKAGLGKILAQRGKAFAVTELTQNAWDQNVQRVDITLAPHDDDGVYVLTVTDDDAEGFSDLKHAYTLFAESEKKSDPTRRGRYDLGEKLVIAIARNCTIATTKGTIHFDDAGRHHRSAKRAVGSEVRAELHLSTVEAAEVAAVVYSLIPPAGIVTTFNGVELAQRQPITSFEVSLPTVLGDADGNLRPTRRKTRVDLYEPLPDEVPSLYEMGIPVVEVGDRYHVDIQQKIPLNLDRDNVTPAYLRAVRSEVLNHAHTFLREDDSDASWITEALQDDRTTAEALNAALDLRFGEKRVVFDPSDHEANKRAAAAGYEVIAARSLPKGVAGKARELGVLQAAGAVTPSPRPYDNESDPRTLKPSEQWTPAEANMADYARALGERLLGRAITVKIVNDPKCMNFAATYARLTGTLEFNLRTLGRRFFEAGPGPEADALIIHELAHNTAGDHLSEAYYTACCELGARMVAIALAEPEFFKAYSQPGVALVGS